MNQLKRVHFSTSLLLTIGIVLLLASSWPFRSAYAQRADVKITAQLGLDGYCKDGTWIPARVTMENTGPDINGRVQVSFQNESGGLSRYGQDIALPTTSRKDVFLYFYPPQFIRNLKVSLVAGDKVVSEQKLTLSCLSTDNMLFGVMSDAPAAYDILNEVQPLDGFVKVAHVQPEDLPDQVQGWAGLDALIVAGVDTGTLTQAQRESLSTWIAGGGKLLIVGGPAWQETTAGLQDFLPVDIASTQTLTGLPDLQKYLQSSVPIESQANVSVGNVHKDAVVLVKQEGIPLLVEKDMGFGKVIYLAADPSLRPLSEWQDMKKAYDLLLGTRSVRPEWMKQQWDSYSANQAASTLNALNIPPFLSVCGWLVLYVIVIGPVNFFVLRRSKRRDLAWLTIPVLAIIFSALAYFYGSAYRGRHPILNRIAVIQAWDRSTTADVHALVGLYSPRRTKYTLEANNQFMFYPFQNNSSGVQTGDNWLSSRVNAGSTLPEVQVEIGAMKIFSMQGNIPAVKFNHDLVITVSNDDPVLSGAIVNDSKFILRDAVIFTSGEWKSLGDLAPGASTDINLSLTPGMSGPEFYSLEAYQILGTASPTYGYGSDEVAVRREAILNAVKSSSNYYYGNFGNWGVYLLGWIDEPMLPVSVQGERFDAIDTNLYIIRLTPAVQFASSTWEFTPGLMSWESSLSGASPYFSNEVPPGGYVLRFRPAVPVSFGSVKQLTLNINTVSGIPPSDVSASLWNFETAQWEKVENLTWGLNDIREPARYVGPAGEAQLKLDSLANYSVQVSPATLTLVVGP